jgi:hypothetical protein
MNILLNLSEEQSDVLQDVVAQANSLLKEGVTPYSIETYLSFVLNKAVNSYVETAYAAAVTRIGEKAASLPYSERKALISQLDVSIG